MEKVLLVSFLIFAGVLAVSAQNACPEIIPRGGWSARTPRFVPVLPIRPAPLVVIHPANVAPCTNQAACSEAIRNIQTFQMEVNGWPDISYHFLIGADYRIYEGRGWGRVGENVENFTNQAINIAYLGRFAVDPPSERATELLDSLIACGIAQGSLAPDVVVAAQCQVIPRIASCERSTIFNWITQHPRFESDPTPV